MIRAEEFESSVGQAAWEFFKHWFNKQNRRVRSKDSFLTSRYYTSFMKFAKFVKDTNMPEPDRFVEWMIDKNYDPKMWTRDEVYRSYLEHLDRAGDPYIRAATTIKTIQRLMDEEHCQFHEIFEHITPQVVIHYLYSRQLSPWLLLHSPKFWGYYKNKLSNADRTIIDVLIRASFWKERFNKETEAAEAMKAMVKRLKLRTLPLSR